MCSVWQQYGAVSVNVLGYCRAVSVNVLGYCVLCMGITVCGSNMECIVAMLELCQ